MNTALDILKQGVDMWNKWREENPDIQPDLSNAHFNKDFYVYHFQGINLSGVDLTKTVVVGDFKDANFSSAILRGAEFCVAYLDSADLSNTDLRDSFFEGTTFEGVNFSGADLRNTTIIESSISGDTVNYVNLSGVNLSSANLSKMDLHAFDFSKADLSKANLKGADLRWANLSEANLHAAKLNGATISWANLSEADISRADLTGCRIYAISAWNVRLDDTTKQKNLVITRDDEPTVTVDDLEVAQFIYLLLNNQKIRRVINTIVPNLSSVPVQPLLHIKAKEYAMFEHFTRYPWVLEAHRYSTIKQLLASLKECVIQPAEEKARELEQKK